MLEIYAIAKALEMAREALSECGSEAETKQRLHFYSDCLGAWEYFPQFGQTLTQLRRVPYGEELVGAEILAAEELSALNVAVEFRYVPGHAGVFGNVMTDRAARRGAKHSVGK